MAMSDYYRNAGLPVPKSATAPQKLSPVDFVVTAAKNTAHAALNLAADAISAPVVGYQKARGAYYDNQRGNTLYKEGYGKYYDSASTIAAQGRSGGQQRPKR